MPGTQIKVFDKIVQVIEVLATSSQGVTLRQVQDASGLNKGTAFRILRCLQSHNLAVRSADGTYSFGNRILWWASRHQHNPDLSKLVRPHLEKLRHLTSETAVFSLVIGDRSVVDEQATSPHVTSTRYCLGDSAPLYAGATGRVILAHLDSEQRKKLLRQRLQRFTERTITDKRRLERELDRCISQGFAYSEGERISNTSSIATPVFGPQGKVLGALAIAGPSGRITRDKRKSIVPLLLREARLLTEQLESPVLANRRAVGAL
ncbi:MAG: IclR family transcriptional regulator [Deltaproteobacteria bacterium]|nr:MAG: IclR family transcriptional regulator [Deltaproteobacteria bacterium]